MASAVVVPAILTNNPAVYQQQMSAYVQFSKRIQLDISDGEFSPTVTISEAGLQFPQGVEVDLHMMVLRPSEHLQAIVAAKPALVILHAEAGENLLPVFDELKKAGIKTGVALLQATYPGRVKPYIEAVDHVMIFAGAMQTEKVALIKAIKPEVEIGWDGGANMKNIRTIGHSGVNVINVGSALAQSQEPAATYDELVKESDRPGVAL